MKLTVKTTGKKLPYRRKWFFILFVIVLLSFLIYKENTTVGETHYEIVSTEIPDSYDEFTRSDI